MRALSDFAAHARPFRHGHAADAVTGRVVKVLPFLLDQQGRAALSPEPV